VNECNNAKFDCTDAKEAVIAAHAKVMTQMCDVKVAEEPEKSTPTAAERTGLRAQRRRKSTVVQKSIKAELKAMLTREPKPRAISPSVLPPAVKGLRRSRKIAN
jgi:hypothetical protein